ncbi:MAG: EthD family reductase [Candidatus Solibacter sp.]
MIKVSVLYPNSDGATFDMDYYCASHLPLVQKVLGSTLKGLSADLGVPGQGPYIAMGHLLFESVAAFQTCLATHGPTLLADIPNYTNTQPVFQVSETKL